MLRMPHPATSSTSVSRSESNRGAPPRVLISGVFQSARCQPIRIEPGGAAWVPFVHNHPGKQVSADQNRTGGRRRARPQGTDLALRRVSADPESNRGAPPRCGGWGECLKTVSADQNRTGGRRDFVGDLLETIAECQPIRIEPGGAANGGEQSSPIVIRCQPIRIEPGGAAPLCASRRTGDV